MRGKRKSKIRSTADLRTALYIRLREPKFGLRIESITPPSDGSGTYNLPIRGAYNLLPPHFLVALNVIINDNPQSVFVCYLIVTVI